MILLQNHDMGFHLFLIISFFTTKNLSFVIIVCKSNPVSELILETPEPVQEINS
jgi:hypothetical protein